MRTNTPYPRARIVALARAQLGVRFVHRGRDPAHGFDCLGFVWWVGRQLGARLPDELPPYAPNGSLRWAERMLGEWLVALDTTPKPGHIFLAAVEGMPRHLGILASVGRRPTIVHASLTAGAVVEHGIGDLRLYGLYAYRFGD